jgi:dihydrolipoamide dehydrogenase
MTVSVAKTARPPDGAAAPNGGTYDVVVIGSGPGGYVAAVRAGQLGLKTAIVEQDASLGGTCLHRGCIPTKALLHAADLLSEMQHAKDFGLAVENPRVDMAALAAYRNRVVLKNAKGVEFLMKKNKVDVLHGRGKLAGAGKVTVTGADGARTVATKNVILASGSTVRALPGFEFDQKQIISSDQALTLEQIPKSMVVLGAGAVGVEFASIYHRFGSQVTLVELLPRVLPVEDEEVSAELEKIFKKQGIQVLTGTKAERVEKAGNELKVHLKGADGQAQVIPCEVLLVAVGRGPVSDGLGYAEAGVAIERGYVKVDEYMRTSVQGVYAIGDIVAIPNRPHPQLAHLASHEGILVAEVIAGEDEVRPIDYDQVPGATYCSPEVASVGLTEAEAKKRGITVRIGRFPFSANSKASILLESGGFVKIVADAEYEQVLGVHIIGPRATELIGECVTALKLEATAAELYRSIHAHPTLSEALMEAAHGVTGHPIHI